MKLLSAAALLLSTILLNGPPKFDARAVWNPPYDVWQQMREACQTEPPPVECVTGFMRQHGARAQAVEFSRQVDGSAYMIDFRRIGRLAVALVLCPFNNHPCGELIVNGSPPIVDPAEIVFQEERAGRLDIRKDPLYPMLLRKYPHLMLWEGDARFQSARGQRLIFSMRLLDGCFACGAPGEARIAIDFDVRDHFQGCKLLRLVPAGGK
jgi:hypothetical protein